MIVVGFGAATFGGAGTGGSWGMRLLCLHLPPPASRSESSLNRRSAAAPKRLFNDSIQCLSIADFPNRLQRSGKMRAVMGNHRRSDADLRATR